jgi:hypothetical protein
MPLTPEQFRRLALALEGAEEDQHMGHPDFRVGDKIFATLGYPDHNFAMVRLTPEQQRDYTAFEPAMFSPVKGGWGLRGATSVDLRAATAKAVKPALEAAWSFRLPKKKGK